MPESAWACRKLHVGCAGLRSHILMREAKAHLLEALVYTRPVFFKE